MTPTAVGILGESFFCGATAAMSLFCCRRLLARIWLNIERAELLPAFPAPRATTASPYDKSSTRLEPAGKDIVACGIL
jgi:hypothetical protein